MLPAEIRVSSCPVFLVRTATRGWTEKTSRCFFLDFTGGVKSFMKKMDKVMKNVY